MENSISVPYQGQQEILPSLSLDMEHRLVLTDKQKELLLEERQHLIEDSIHSIQNSFFSIGKALAEIKKFKLYKADPFYPTWREYISHRVSPKLHQSTISDYIGIVKMQLDHKDFIKQEELIRLGYKKVKLLKAKIALIQKENDLHVKRGLMEKLKEIYSKSFQEFRDVPYTTYETILSFVPSEKRSSNHTIEKVTENFTFKLDKKNNKITIIPNSGDHKVLEKFYDMISDIK